MDDLQRSTEWFKERCGKFTGSKFASVMARNKKTGLPLKEYFDLIADIVVERFTGEPVEGPKGFALAWGVDVEPAALEAYELETGYSTEQVGFIPHPKYEFVGCSPDSLVGEDGGLEMKCPKSSRVHLERFTDGLPEEYKAQVQGCMWVTGRQWWDFVSFDPRMPDSHQLLIIRIERDDAYIKDLEREVIQAEAIVQARLDALMKVTR